MDSHADLLVEHCGFLSVLDFRQRIIPRHPSSSGRPRRWIHSRSRSVVELFLYLSGTADQVKVSYESLHESEQLLISL